jgi:hypothetical protein
LGYVFCDTLQECSKPSTKYSDKIWGKYGFADDFNPQTGWVSTNTLGLDVGMTLLAAENLSTGNLWKWFMANPSLRKP